MSTFLKTDIYYILYFLINNSYMCLGADKQLKKENTTISNSNRRLQSSFDTVRSQKEKLQMENANLKNERDRYFAQLKARTETIENIENKATIFKINFHKELTENHKKAKNCFTTVQQCKIFSQLELKQIVLVYQSIEAFFYPQFAQNKEQIIFILSQVYNLINASYYNTQKLIFSIRRYTKLIKEIITQGYTEKQDQQLKLARDFLSNNVSDFYKELEQLIKLSKEKYSKDKSRILEQSGIDSNNDELKLEIKLQNKITELQTCIEKLKLEKEKAQEENHLFQTITIPRLRDQLHKKQAKEFEEIKDTLHKMDKKFIDKDVLLSELEEMKGQIRNIIYSTSNQEMVDIIKAKDLKISNLEKKLAVNQAKKLSEWSQETELSNKRVQNVMNTKDREIQDLKRSLNQQKEAFQEISSQMIQKQKLLSDSFLIQENLSVIEKQKIHLSSQLQKAQQKITFLQKQLTLLQQNASKQASRKSNEQKAKQQLNEIKIRMKLLLDDNTTQKQKRALLTIKLNDKEGQIQSLKEELGSLSSQNQTLSMQIQQVISLKQGLTLKNQQLTQQIQVYKNNQKANIQKHADFQQREKIEERNQMLSIQNKLMTQKQQLEKKITDLKLTKQSLSVSMQKMRKRFQAQLEQKVFSYSNLQLSFNNLQLLKFQLQNQIKALSKQVKQLRIQAKDKESLLQYRRDAIEQIQTLKLSLEKENKTVISLQNEVKCLKQLNMKMGQKLHQLSSSNQSSRVRSVSFVEHRTLFIGEILEKKKVQKKYLMNTIQTVMKQQIQKTEKLYQFKRDRNINPHTFIDGHSNLVIIVQTQKALIAAFYSGTLQSKIPMTSQALIFSLDNKKSYQLKENPNSQADNRTPKGMVYDQYYIIFGNTQIRIRSGQAKIFSNFGTLSSFFNSRGDKINALLRDGNNNEVDLLNYEIHQVHFSENYILESLQ